MPSPKRPYIVYILISLCRSTIFNSSFKQCIEKKNFLPLQSDGERPYVCSRGAWEANWWLQFQANHRQALTVLRQATPPAPGDKPRPFLENQPVMGDREIDYLLTGVQRKNKQDVLPQYELIVKFFSRIANFTGLSDGCYHQVIDSYYLPKSKAENLLAFFIFFREYENFMENVVPMTIYGMFESEKIINLPGKNLWGVKNRTDFWNFYRPETDAFLHPLKFSDKSLSKHFCSKHIRSYIKVN